MLQLLQCIYHLRPPVLIAIWYWFVDQYQTWALGDYTSDMENKWPVKSQLLRTILPEIEQIVWKRNVEFEEKFSKSKLSDDKEMRIK